MTWPMYCKGCSTTWWIRLKSTWTRSLANAKKPLQSCVCYCFVNPLFCPVNAQVDKKIGKQMRHLDLVRSGQIVNRHRRLTLLHFRTATAWLQHRRCTRYVHVCACVCARARMCFVCRRYLDINSSPFECALVTGGCMACRRSRTF